MTPDPTGPEFCQTCGGTIGRGPSDGGECDCSSRGNSVYLTEREEIDDLKRQNQVLKGRIADLIESEREKNGRLRDALWEIDGIAKQVLRLGPRDLEEVWAHVKIITEEATGTEPTRQDSPDPDEAYEESREREAS